jgi:hypothetical protein
MKIRQVLVAGAAVMMMAGCADYGVGYYGPGPVAAVDYDGYYDGYYGPIYDGYWNGGSFYYRTRAGGHWRKGGNHFRRTESAGFNHIQGTAHPDHRGADRHRPG